MEGRTDALTAGLLAPVVATNSAYPVGRDRRFGLMAGGLSGAMRMLATALPRESDPDVDAGSPC